MAEIVRFPARPEDRLRAALRALDAALSEQHAALAQFRGNLSLLGGAMAGLEDSVRDYRESLSRTAEDVAQAHASARRLERTAEIWLRD